MNLKVVKMFVIENFLEHKGSAYLYVMLTEAFVLVCGLLVYKLAAFYFGTEGFGEYASAKRMISVLTFTLLVGLGISIPRYIASAEGLPRRYSDAYFVSGIAIGMAILFAFVIVMSVFKGQLAFLFFGSVRYDYLIPAMMISIAGICAHTLAYSYYRGYLKMFGANVLEIVDLGIAPVVAFSLYKGSASAVLLLAGLIQLIFASFAILLILRRIDFKGLGIQILKNSARDLLAFGIVRVPGEFALFALFSLPVTFMAHSVNIERAGYISFGISMIILIGSFFSFIGIILLPVCSQLVVTNRFDELRKTVYGFLVASLGLTVALVVVFERFAYPIITVYLGERFSGAADDIAPLLFSAIPYVTYILLRNPLDAITVWPHNSRNLIVTLLVLGSLLSFGRSYLSVQISLLIALSGLAILMLYSFARSARERVETAHENVVLALADPTPFEQIERERDNPQ